MTYRDDRDADQARIAALESELAQANRRVGELEGRRDQALVLASGATSLARADPGRSAATTWFGAPIRLAMSRRFDGAYPIDRFEQLIERVRELTGDPGRTELLRSSLTWRATANERGVGPFTVVTVAVKDPADGEQRGHTTLTVTDRLGSLAGGLFGGLFGGLGGGGLVAPIAASVAIPVLAPVFVLGWLGGVYAGTRALYRRAARRRAESLQQLFDALVVEIDARLR
jgi:hypothetical protein